MTLTLVVRKLDQTEISRYVDIDGALERLIESAPKRSLLSGVDPNARTMFNDWQLQTWVVAEIAALNPQTDAEKQAATQLHEFAVKAARSRGHIWFYGDSGWI